MRNAPTIAVRGSTPANAKGTYHIYLGWCDAAKGLPFCKEYETFDPWLQRNYERGRQWAICAKASLGFVPLWKKNAKLETALKKHREIVVGFWRECNQNEVFASKVRV